MWQGTDLPTVAISKEQEGSAMTSVMVVVVSAAFDCCDAIGVDSDGLGGLVQGDAGVQVAGV